MKAKGKRLQYQISGTLLSEIILNFFFLFPSTFHAVTSQRVSAGHPRLASKFAFPAPSLRHHGFISGDFGIGQIYICPLTSTSTEAAAAAAAALA